jgi:lambda family phage portal protein
MATLPGIFAAGWTKTMTFLGLGGYSTTESSNKITRDFRPSQRSALDLAVSDLPTVRAQGRQLDRIHGPARAATEAIAANIVGSGIALHPDTGDEVTDKKLLDAWNTWIETCGINGETLWQLQTQAARELAPVGEFIWRIVVIPDAEVGTIPLRVMPLESEWLAQYPGTSQEQNTTFAAGKELDKFGRAVATHLEDPNGRWPGVERVPEKWIIHGFEPRRAVMVRGEPWLAPVIQTMLQERRLVDAELRSAENTAGMAAAITQKDAEALATDDGAGSTEINIGVGSVFSLNPGEDIKTLSHTRPAQQIAPFREMLAGDEAGALRIGKRWLNRDVSKANYSSLRADMLDSERLLGPTREWFGHKTAGKLYQAVLPYLALMAGIPVPKRKAYRLLPDGQPYVDPGKDIAAATSAINGKLSNYESEISKRGGDYRQVWAQANKEQVEMAVAEIDRITEIQRKINDANNAVPGLNLNWAQIATIGGAASAPGAYLQAAASSSQVAATVEQIQDPEAGRNNANEPEPEMAGS